MITFQTEAFADVYEPLQKMFPLHWEELALNKDKVPLDPDYDVYKQAEQLGQLLVLTCRKDGDIIGYFVGFVRTDLHYKTCLTCRMDIFFIHPDHRGGSLGIKLFTELKKVCKSRGVKRIVVGSKVHKDASKLFEFLGYSEIERFYSLFIGD